MSLFRQGIFIVGCKRTPFGSAGGSLRDISPIELGSIAAKAAIEAVRSSSKSTSDSSSTSSSSTSILESIDSVIVGNVIAHSDPCGNYIARHVALRTGVPIEVPCLAVNRLCGSGFQATISGAMELDAQTSDPNADHNGIVLTIGTESMSRAPYVVRGARYGVRFGTAPTLEDSLFGSRPPPTDSRFETRMGITAENLAEKYRITREEADRFAFRSQQRWLAAHQAGRFASEIVPVSVKIRGVDSVIDTDEHPRPDTNMEKLAKLSPAFKRDGIVTAGNASGINDGAGAIVLASDRAIERHTLTPLSRIVGYSVVGCDPAIMGIGPVPAIRRLLACAKLRLDQIDLIEVNEAFAAQWLAVDAEMHFDHERTNANGGAIALGHPLGASGSRILTNLTYELARRKARYAIGSACIGGGQGIAVLLENVATSRA